MTEPSFSNRAFRDALSAFATGVTIITTRDDGGEPVGMTASSFNSVSLDPPLILWSVGKNALSAETFRSSERFAVHVLGTGQIALSNRFAKSGTDKFDGIDYDHDLHGLPRLSDALARFSCKTHAVHEGGDHWIVVGEVVDLEAQSGEPLLFAKGAYAGTQDLAPEADTIGNGGGASDGGVDTMLVYNLSRAYHQLSEQLHIAVEAAGLTLPQWRVLASLYGQRRRTYEDLASRTFVNTQKLDRLLVELERDGLCSVSGHGEGRVVDGTRSGHARVEPLFVLSQRHEQTALDSSSPEARQRLVQLLQTIVANTGAAQSGTAQDKED
ncbi:MAG: flavin reductase [Pseudomonadota bacterium]